MPDIKSKYKVDAGKLIHPIEIQRKTTSKPINGIVEDFWETLYAPRAAVSNATGKEYLKDGIELYGRISKKFTVRTNRHIELLPSDRILYNGNYYDVTSVYDYDDVGMFTVLVAIRSEQ